MRRVRLPPAAALGRGRREARGRGRRRYGARTHLRRARPARPPAGALVRDGRERRGQVDAPQARRGRGARRTRASVTVGASVKMGYFAQHAMELLDAEKTRARDAPGRRSRWRPSARCAALAGAFGFSGDDVEKPCRVLSGGEKARLVLATMLYDPPNFLVLDEPTNHLDMATKEMLVKALADFEGTMLFVSHDRQLPRARCRTACSSSRPRACTPTAAGTPSTSRSTGHEAPGVS